MVPYEECLFHRMAEGFAQSRGVYASSALRQFADHTGGLVGHF
jgi:hypothetical protein